MSFFFTTEYVKIRLQLQNVILQNVFVNDIHSRPPCLNSNLEETHDIYVCGPKKIESYFSDRLNFSNIRGSTSCQIYRLALPLSTPEMLSSLIKSRIFLNNAHLALFVWMDDTITSTNALVSIVI